MKHIAPLVSIAVLSLTSFNVSMANVDDAPKSKLVRFADLELSRIDGAAALYNRLQGAARAVCGSRDYHRLVRRATLVCSMRRF